MRYQRCWSYIFEMYCGTLCSVIIKQEYLKSIMLRLRRWNAQLIIQANFTWMISTKDSYNLNNLKNGRLKWSFHRLQYSKSWCTCIMRYTDLRQFDNMIKMDNRIGCHLGHMLCDTRISVTNMGISDCKWSCWTFKTHTDYHLT